MSYEDWFAKIGLNFTVWKAQHSVEIQRWCNILFNEMYFEALVFVVFCCAASFAAALSCRRFPALLAHQDVFVSTTPTWAVADGLHLHDTTLQRC